MGLTGSFSAARPKSVLVSPAEWDSDNAVIWLRGEHDLSTIAALSAIFSRAIAHDDADLTLDLSEVLFIDAATVGTIVGLRKRLRLESRSLSLRSPSRCALRLLDLCDLADLIAPTPIDATSIAAGSAAALATWVAVPTTGPAEEPETLPPKPTRTPEPVLAVLDPAKQTVS